MKKKARFWLHCSHIDHGPEFTPDLIKPKYAGLNEPTTPRLCVARTVTMCLVARPMTPRCVYVYRTAKPYRALKAVGVWDSPLTGERWLIPPVSLVLAAVIPKPVTEAACRATVRDVIKRNAADLKTRLITLGDAITAFDQWADKPDIGSPWVGNFDRQALKILRKKEAA